MVGSLIIEVLNHKTIKEHHSCRTGLNVDKIPTQNAGENNPVIVKMGQLMSMLNRLIHRSRIFCILSLLVFSFIETITNV